MTWQREVDGIEQRKRLAQVHGGADAVARQHTEIVFNVGSHWQTVRMRYDDYVRIVHPKIAKFADHR